MRRNQVYDMAYKQCQQVEFMFQNSITRHMQSDYLNMYEFERSAPLNDTPVRLSPPNFFICYGCGKKATKAHAVYLFSCTTCGNKFQRLRDLSCDLTDHVAVVVGGRTKIGHQCVLKLILAGATVVTTSRRPDLAQAMFERYPGYAQWGHRLDIYPRPLDLNVSNLSDELLRLYVYIASRHDGVTDILIICAAQTIRSREQLISDSVKQHATQSAEIISDSVKQHATQSAEVTNCQWLKPTFYGILNVTFVLIVIRTLAILFTGGTVLYFIASFLFAAMASYFYTYHTDTVPEPHQIPNSEPHQIPNSEPHQIPNSELKAVQDPIAVQNSEPKNRYMDAK